MLEPRRFTRRFAREEIERIVAEISIESPRELRDRALLRLGHEDSLRTGELTEPTWCDITFDESPKVKVRGHSSRAVRIATLYEQEEPLAAGCPAW